MSGQTSPIFGNLDWTVTPFTDVIQHPGSSTIVGAAAATILVLGGIAVLALLTRKGWWGPL